MPPKNNVSHVIAEGQNTGHPCNPCQTSTGCQKNGDPLGAKCRIDGPTLPPRGRKARLSGQVYTLSFDWACFLEEPTHPKDSSVNLLM